MIFQIIFIISEFSNYLPYDWNPIRTINRLDTFIHDCFFTTISNPGAHGGVLSYSVSNVFMLIIRCTFNNCFINGASICGGAIYFSCVNSSIIMNKICANDCYTIISSGNHGIFGFFSLTSSVSFSFKILDSSFSSCSLTKRSTSYSTIYSSNSVQNIINVNSSKNNAGRYSFGFFSSSQAINFLFCSIVDTNSNTYNFYVSSQIISKFNYGNFVRNNPVSSTIIYSNYNAFSLENSIFEQNSGIIFSGSLYVINCSIQHLALLINGGGIILSQSNCINHELCLMTTYQFSHFETYLCPTMQLNILPTKSYLPCLPNPSPTPAQTMPLSPSQCDDVSNQKVLEEGFGKLMALFFISTFFLFIFN